MIATRAAVVQIMNALFSVKITKNLSLPRTQYFDNVSLLTGAIHQSKVPLIDNVFNAF